MKYKPLPQLSAAATCLTLVAAAHASDLRIATYNIEADIGGYTTPRPGLDQVLEAIGTQNVSGIAQPIDILALQETTSNTTTVDPIVSALNSYYTSIGSPASYARSPYQATQSGSNGSGNGPNALIYNSSTLTLLAAVGLGTPANVDREPVRYEFQPAGGTPAEDFYVYVSHYKSGTGSSNAADRQAEASLIRSDEASLPATARVLYMGDFNTGAPNDLFNNLMAAGQGQAFDLLSPTDTPSTIYQPVATYSESATDLRYRDDDQFATQNVLTDAAGLQFIAGSYRSFGNNGTTAGGKSVNLTTNTALSNLTQPFANQQSTLLTDLTTASDHLPTVADYKLPLLGDANLDGVVNLVDFLIMDATYLTGTTNATWRTGDFNGDGIVDYRDYAIALASFQDQAASPANSALASGLYSEYSNGFGSAFINAYNAAIPEPASLALLTLGALILMTPRERRPGTKKSAL